MSEGNPLVQVGQLNCWLAMLSLLASLLGGEIERCIYLRSDQFCMGSQLLCWVSSVHLLQAFHLFEGNSADCNVLACDEVPFARGQCSSSQKLGSGRINVSQDYHFPRHPTSNIRHLPRAAHTTTTLQLRHRTLPPANFNTQK
jgi:hypothetical protein